jgi:hypothetical protein
MRLNIEVETKQLQILNGPGATALLEVACKLLEQGGQYRMGHPIYVEFTVGHPVTGDPMPLKLEVVGGLQKFVGSYRMEALAKPALETLSVVYWLSEVPTFGRGYIQTDKDES